MGCGYRFEPAEWWAEAARRSLPNGKFADTQKVPKAGDVVVRSAKYAEPEVVQVWDVNMKDVIAKTLDAAKTMALKKSFSTRRK